MDTEPRRSWASTRAQPRCCLDLLVRSADGNVVARCPSDLWETFTSDHVLMGARSMERMLHQEVVLDTRGVESMHNLDLYYMTDWVLPVLKTRVIISTRRSADEWRNALVSHNSELDNSGLPRVYRLLNADGSEFCSTKKGRKGDADDSKAEGARNRVSIDNEPKNRLKATPPSLKLPLLQDEELTEWFQPFRCCRCSTPCCLKS
ncbi:unnamed protein product [Polarella glacialis]|uniref:Uncharacterized protein n=1 Tax=Polarella glacialis TaxID=89957 RepID=A0A813F541_POLGL|nr:unnamed protein product [Polarella glacialis]